jgi:hypothetical protein
MTSQRVKIVCDGTYEGSRSGSGIFLENGLELAGVKEVHMHIVHGEAPWAEIVVAHPSAEFWALTRVTPRGWLYFKQSLHVFFFSFGQWLRRKFQ